jgi:hypothetical protein
VITRDQPSACLALKMEIASEVLPRHNGHQNICLLAKVKLSCLTCHVAATFLQNKQKRRYSAISIVDLALMEVMAMS